MEHLKIIIVKSTGTREKVRHENESRRFGDTEGRKEGKTAEEREHTGLKKENGQD